MALVGGSGAGVEARAGKRSPRWLQPLQSLALVPHRILTSPASRRPHRLDPELEAEQPSDEQPSDEQPSDEQPSDTVPPPSAGPGTVPAARPGAGPPGGGFGPPGGTSTPPPSGWTGGRIASIVTGIVLVVISLALLAGGTVALWVNQTQRSDGYVTHGPSSLSTNGYALATEGIDLSSSASSVLGTVRVRAVGERPLFLGIARQEEATTYLSGFQHTDFSNLLSSHPSYTQQPGVAPPVPPGTLNIWTVQSSGPGSRAVTWTPTPGNWTVVAMNADGSRGLSLRIDFGATLPWLPWAAGGMLAGWAVFLAGGLLLIVFAAKRASATSRGPYSAPPPPGR